MYYDNGYLWWRQYEIQIKNYAVFGVFCQMVAPVGKLEAKASRILFVASEYL